jgi:hypothetical protein
VNLIDRLFINKKLCTLGISLFEEQIVRALFLSDDFYFLKQLSVKFDVIIFTNQDIGNFLDTRVKELGISRTKIIVLENIKESFFVKVFSFCLKWSDPSTATMRTLHRERMSHRITIFGYWLRKVYFFVFSRSVLLKSILRQLLFFAYKLDDIEKASKFPIPTIDLFLATALTNSESDLPLSIYFKRQSIPVIASLRSWDNLVTKGTLKFQPDLLLSHSKYMTDLAVRIHGIKSASVIQSVTPSYQKRFLPEKRKNNSGLLKITYGCIGPILNPDELNFINWLGEISTKTNASITIVQHPKFKHDLSTIDTGSLVFRTFNYLSTTLHDYYEFIAEQDLVIASGTSFALDTLFVQTPLIGLAFEIVKQDYWFSHLRSYDTLPHSKHLFNELAIKKISSKQELVELLKSSIFYQNFEKSTDSLLNLTGDTDIRFDDQILYLLS